MLTCCILVAFNQKIPNREICICSKKKNKSFKCQARLWTAQKQETKTKQEVCRYSVMTETEVWAMHGRRAVLYAIPKQFVAFRIHTTYLPFLSTKHKPHQLSNSEQWEGKIFTAGPQETARDETIQLLSLLFFPCFWNRMIVYPPPTYVGSKVAHFAQHTPALVQQRGWSSSELRWNNIASEPGLRRVCKVTFKYDFLFTRLWPTENWRIPAFVDLLVTDLYQDWA